MDGSLPATIRRGTLDFREAARTVLRSISFRLPPRSLPFSQLYIFLSRNALCPPPFLAFVVFSPSSCLPSLCSSTFLLAFPHPPHRRGSLTPAHRGVARAAFVRRASVKVKRRKSGFEDEPSNLLSVDVVRDTLIEPRALSRGPRGFSFGRDPTRPGTRVFLPAFEVEKIFPLRCDLSPDSYSI